MDFQWEWILRLCVAGLLGAFIGMEREYRAKEAGYRTHFLISLGSALFTLVSIYGFEAYAAKTGVQIDPSRLAAQIVTGIGFLGAGSIVIQKYFVRGLTTAAGIWATAGIGLCVYTLVKFPAFRLRRRDMRLNRQSIREITSYSTLTCAQQSVMNFGILMVQGLVNSFGTSVMAAFAAAVKIDSFAYMPAQDFGNAFSTFIAQNFGAGRNDRIHRGIRGAVWMTTLFCLCLSAVIFLFAKPLMRLFISAEETKIIAIGAEYLRVEGSFYVGIGYLFLLYGFYRAVRKPEMSVVLTVLSLGTRVALAYALAAIPAVGVHGIWWSIPIGWALADLAGVWYYQRRKNALGLS